MPRPLRSDKELEAAAHHVSYEIEMLMHAARYIGIGHGSPATTPIGNDKNMALESFLLHFRNLRSR